jgi:uncharacterized protein YjiS (DUF1127 family)
MTHEHSVRRGGAFERASIHERTFPADIPDRFWDWIERWRARRELLEYMATEHRAASDLGTTENEAKTWATKPFWRE